MKISARLVSSAAPSPRLARLVRLAIVAAGIFLGQAAIYGPSLFGGKILLPLDNLMDVCETWKPEGVAPVPHDPTYWDLILQFEPDRRFAVDELRSGRLPFWDPCQYAGAPFVWPKYSPFLLLGCATPSPKILAWLPVFEALIAGIGAYCFFRRALGASFWAAALPAWCYPLTGFFVFWQGFPTSMAVYWLPWLLLAITAIVRRPTFFAVAGLSAATGLTLVSGHIDVAAQTLLVSGLFAIWCWLDAYCRAWRSSSALRAIGALVLGWGLGFMLGSPHLLPILEYVKTGARMINRSAGGMERPPGSLAQLPLAVLPDLNGPERFYSIMPAAGTQIDSAAMAYAGMLATLFLAPLAWCQRRCRSGNLFWSALTLFGFSWCLGLPFFVPLLRLPVLNMLSPNRLVIGSTFALLAMASTGIDVLIAGRWPRRWWFCFPMLALAAICGFCVWRMIQGPEEIAAIEPVVRRGGQVSWLQNMGDVEALRAWFFWTDLAAAVAAALGVAGWMLVSARESWPRWLIGVLGAVMLADMVWFAHDRVAQCDPALYYPRIPALEQIAARGDGGRVIGYGRFPAQLSAMFHLNDVRGYDSVDPARIIDLVKLAAAPDSIALSYAAIEWLKPKIALTPDGRLRLSPVLDLLGVRYLISDRDFGGTLKPAARSPRCSVFENSFALPRVFIPRRVETVADGRARLAKLGAADFDPREVAYVESPLSLDAPARGAAEIRNEIPTRITIDVRMETPGLLLLADQWDVGWKATFNGQPVPILRVDHALRGVVLPSGQGVLELRYASRTVFLGFLAAGLAGAALIACLLFGRSQRPLHPPVADRSLCA